MRRGLRAPRAAPQHRHRVRITRFRRTGVAPAAALFSGSGHLLARDFRERPRKAKRSLHKQNECSAGAGITHADGQGEPGDASAGARSGLARRRWHIPRSGEHMPGSRPAPGQSATCRTSPVHTSKVHTSPAQPSPAWPDLAWPGLAQSSATTHVSAVIHSFSGACLQPVV